MTMAEQLMHGFHFLLFDKFQCDSWCESEAVPPTTSYKYNWGEEGGRCTDGLLCPHLQQGADTDRAVRVLIWMLHYSSTESLYGWGLGPGSELLRKVVLKTSGDGGERMRGGISHFTHPLQRVRRHRHGLCVLLPTHQAVRCWPEI